MRSAPTLAWEAVECQQPPPRLKSSDRSITWHKKNILNQTDISAFKDFKKLPKLARVHALYFKEKKEFS